MQQTRLWGSRLKKYGLLKFVPNNKDNYQEEREIQDAVKNMSLGTRYYSNLWGNSFLRSSYCYVNFRIITRHNYFASKEYSITVVNIMKCITNSSPSKCTFSLFYIIIIITYYFLLHFLALLGHHQGELTTGKMDKTFVYIITRKCSYCKCLIQFSSCIKFSPTMVQKGQNM